MKLFRRLVIEHPIAASAIAAGLVGLYTLARAWGSPDFYPVAVPGVLTGAGTLALAAVTYQVLRGDQEDRRDREGRERRDQAAHVHVGIPSFELANKSIPAGTATRQYWYPTVTLQNGSNYPIRTVLVKLTLSSTQRQKATQNDMIPSGVEHVAQLLPGHEKKFRWQIYWAFDDLNTIVTEAGGPWAEAVFVDIEGATWRRNFDYQLDEVGSDGLRQLFRTDESD